MNYKQKYEEALSRAKYLKENTDSVGALDISANFEYIFPELKESEDEKISKEIIQFLQLPHPQFVGKRNYEEWITWLKKQSKKSIPEDINEAALQYVDTCAVDGRVTHDNITEPYWNNHSMMNAYKAGWLEKQGEQKSWSEDDEKQIRQIERIVKYSGASANLRNKISNWLKSIKPNH